MWQSFKEFDEAVKRASADAMTPAETKAARSKLGMTQGQFGKRLGGVTQGNVSRAENELGIRGCQAQIVRLLLEARESDTQP